MRCTTHKKDFEGDCMWCGKKLCELCIAKAEGRKFYCAACAAQLSQFRRQTLPAAKPAPVPTPAASVPPERSGKFAIDKDGYLTFGGQ